MYGSLDIATSGLVAQRMRLTVISNNLANRETLLDAKGNYAPYRRQEVLLAPGDPSSGREMGVHIAGIEKDDGELLARYLPDSPFADAQGYVGYPNVDPVIEQMNGMEALRAYEANIAVVEATKSMISVALQVLA